MWSAQQLSLLLFGGVLVTGCSVEDPGQTYDFPTKALTSISSDRGLSIEVRTAPSQPPARGQTSVELTITDASDKPVEGLDLTPNLWMPKMGHGSSTHPVVTDEGGGKYRIDECELFMAGDWQLKTQLTSADAKAGADQAVVAFQIQ